MYVCLKKNVVSKPSSFPIQIAFEFVEIKPQKHLFTRFNSIFSFRNEKINSSSSGYFLSCLICSATNVILLVDEKCVVELTLAII